MTRLLDRDATRWIAGAALPVAMVIFDPAVFRSTMSGVIAFFGVLKPFGYIAIACGVAAVACQLLAKRPSAFVAGWLAAGSVFAFTLGLGLLPLSFIGVFFFGVGLLGLTPFVSGLVVGRMAWTAYREDMSPVRAVRCLLAFVLFFGLCGTVQWRASAVLKSSVAQIRSGGPELAREGTARLGRWRALLDFDQLVVSWMAEQDSTRRERLAASYEELTGEDIRQRAVLVGD